jgi:hypothetical protein
VLFYKVTGSVNVRILMRVKYLTPVILLLCLLCWSEDARAQDELPGPDFNSINTSNDPNTIEEKPLLIETDSRTAKPMQSDSASFRTPSVAPVRKVTTPTEGAKKKEETDPLNFNFLFYIIQTFKSSDLMEN